MTMDVRSGKRSEVRGRLNLAKLELPRLQSDDSTRAETASTINRVCI
jgi:hypothetical protein